MTTREEQRRIGETVTLPIEKKLIKKSGVATYELRTGGRYICIREATASQRGILLKVLGKYPSEAILMKDGAPFCKDECIELFYGLCYQSYPFPSLSELKEVLDIVQSNPSLMQYFEQLSMRFNPNATFWVKEAASRLLVLKKPQYYDAHNDQLCPATGGGTHYRLTISYFD